MKKDIEVIVLGEKDVGKREIIISLLTKKSESDFQEKLKMIFIKGLDVIIMKIIFQRRIAQLLKLKKIML